jgi:hypothetical protein
MVFIDRASQLLILNESDDHEKESIATEASMIRGKQFGLVDELLEDQD